MPHPPVLYQSANMPWDYTIPDLTDLNQEERIQLAIDEINRSISTATGLPGLSVRRAHTAFGVP